MKSTKEEFSTMTHASFFLSFLFSGANDIRKVVYLRHRTEVFRRRKRAEDGPRGGLAKKHTYVCVCIEF